MSRREGKRPSQRAHEQMMGSAGACEPCGGKSRFLSKSAAKLCIRRMKGREGRLNAYRCPEDGVFWHLGHPPKELTAGEVARAELKPRGPGRES